MEYLRFGNLERYMNRSFSEDEARTIVLQVLEGLRFMHEDGFAHRDPKPANMFVASTGPAWQVKIGDLGLSKKKVLQSDPNVSLKAAKLNHTAPVDMWSMGVIGFRRLTGHMPFENVCDLFAYVDHPGDTITRALQTKGRQDKCLSLIISQWIPKSETTVYATWTTRDTIMSTGRWGARDDQSVVNLKPPGKSGVWEPSSITAPVHNKTTAVYPGPAVQESRDSTHPEHRSHAAERRRNDDFQHAQAQSPLEEGSAHGSPVSILMEVEDSHVNKAVTLNDLDLEAKEREVFGET
ncbi:kinase-like domain-containing protein [Aspergillus carlsbadensis]|nr:kinase-like domain-containing protein [Aspergillus carlsbadensis]